MKTRLFNAVSHSIVKLRFQQLPKLKFRSLLKIKEAKISVRKLRTEILAASFCASALRANKNVITIFTEWRKKQELKKRFVYVDYCIVRRVVVLYSLDKRI